MRNAELVAGGDVAAESVSRLAGHIHELHDGISGRVFGALGAPAAPVRLLHDGIAGVAYGAVRTLTGGAIRGGVRAAALTRSADAPSLNASPRGRQLVGALNGAFGDALEQHGSALATPMAVVSGGAPVALTRPALTAAFPAATPRVAVFLHGLCETEDAWRMFAARGSGYGARLAAAHGYTTVELRYNTGRHISANGRSLAALLNQLHAAWPIAVEQFALIGHSMGGLVARSACHYGAGSSAISAVRHVVALGAPHHGARLERAAHAAGAALHRLPETRPIASALGARSVGIRDLYHGYLVDEDWEGFEPSAFLVAAAREIPFLDTADHYFVAATLGRDSASPLSRAFGDLLVSRRSAWAQRRPTDHLRFPLGHYTSVGGANHFDLLGHPAIADQLVDWLGDRGAPGVRDRPAQIAAASRSTAA